MKTIAERERIEYRQAIAVAANPRRRLRMTVEEYWQAVARYWSGDLSPEEARHYQIAGILAECAARERGSTLLSYSMQQPEVLPQQLEPETLLVLKLPALVLADLPSDQRVSN
jgi:hypothetical protein